MSWFDKYRVFLFDFDGLLVDSEPLHWEAYRAICKEYGYELSWTFLEFCEKCHTKAAGVREAIYLEFPELEREGPPWSQLYQRKVDIYSRLLETRSVRLMSGVKELLEALNEREVPCGVVTNSRMIHVDPIRKQHPCFEAIDLWVTREDYERPKPDPQGYNWAMERLAKPDERVVGFEDSLKGVNSLLATRADAVLVCPLEQPFLKQAVDKGALHLDCLTRVVNAH